MLTGCLNWEIASISKVVREQDLLLTFQVSAYNTLAVPNGCHPFDPEDRKNMSSVEERVRKIVVEQLGVTEDEVTMEASFVDDLGADSLDTVELVMALEEEFETEIPDEEAEKITTVKLAVDYINAHGG